MNEQEKYDTHNLATLLKDLSKEDLIQVMGVIAGVKLARKCSVENRVKISYKERMK